MMIRLVVITVVKLNLASFDLWEPREVDGSPEYFSRERALMNL